MMKNQYISMQKRNIKNVIILLFCCFIALLSLQSCEKNLKYDLVMDDFKSQLVLNCTFTTDSIWRVYISKSSAIMANESWDNVENAFVTITNSNGGSFILNPSGNGQYTSTQKPEFNQTYKLNVNVPGFESIEASGFQPEQIQIEDVTFTDSIALEDTAYLSQATVSFKDNGASTDFYQIIVYQVDQNNKKISLLPETDDIYVENHMNNSVTNSISYQEYLVATDVLFNGTKHTFSFKFSKAFPNENIFIEVRSLSPALYEYVLSYVKAISNRENPFTEPITIYSSINNGLGIFGGYSSQTRRIEISKK
jgi:hypothetical protein